MYFRCNNCFLLLVYTIHLSLSTDLVDPPPMGTIYMKHPLSHLQHKIQKNNYYLQRSYLFNIKLNFPQKPKRLVRIYDEVMIALLLRDFLFLALCQHFPPPHWPIDKTLGQTMPSVIVLSVQSIHKVIFN